MGRGAGHNKVLGKDWRWLVHYLKLKLSKTLPHFLYLCEHPIEVRGQVWFICNRAAQLQFVNLFAGSAHVWNVNHFHSALHSSLWRQTLRWLFKSPTKSFWGPQRLRMQTHKKNVKWEKSSVASLAVTQSDSDALQYLNTLNFSRVTAVPWWVDNGWPFNLGVTRP